MDTVLFYCTEKTIIMAEQEEVFCLAIENNDVVLKHLLLLSEESKSTYCCNTRCFGFIDGTVRSICRPTKYQRVCYNGHKRVHGLKFQSVVLPNGLIGHLFAPLEGRRHDCALLRHSGLLDQLEERQWRTADGHSFALYGDPAYPNRDFLISPFRGAVLTAEESAFNRAMSSVRECVEWEFGKILSIFAYLDYKKNQKIFLQPVAKYYIVGAILANCHTCLYGNQTSNYFDLRPPTLEEYLHSL